MCPSHLSESLLLDRLRYIVMLSLAYRNQPSFFFSPLLRLPTLPPSKNCLSALLLGYVYPAPHSRLVLMLVLLNFSIQPCSKDVLSYIHPICVWSWYWWLMLVPQGTLGKAWILWSSRKLRVTFKILCKSFLQKLFYSLRRCSVLIIVFSITAPNINR
jgi:hypothetical protein